ncbi:hypothetical protein BD311DRAFT_317968 [Dichomitus squalens]|uniref:Uncharacterized protein n=1 Tax=Dichomitus squalens TaxID=114155 RepID=A0A4Q9MLX3_9APHY|nr:hypothetical protein BD311DRAFT_317968 [Dichomitus squalens]
MDGIPARPAEKPPPYRPPLITPSASPPVSRVWQPKDKPPPSKRPRLSSTPSSSSSVRPPSSSSGWSDLRLESSSRLFQFWDQLAGRYNKPLDEDDIVDLRELKIIKDRGITRSAATSYSIGSLLLPEADPEDTRSEDAETEATGDAEGDGEEESADELDLISPPAVPVKLEYYKTWYVPPADETNPEDAEAFREFEEAEKKRRELFGDDDNEEEEEEIAVTGLEEEEHDLSDHPEQVDEQETDNAALGREHGGCSPSAKRQPQRRKSKPIKPADDDSSEDELAAWDIDDTPLPPRRSVPPPDDIIDLTVSRSPSPAPAPRDRERPQPRASRTQKREPSRARSKPRPLPQSTGKRAQTPERPSSPEQVLQLLTPPRSSSSTADSVPISQQDESPASRADTPSPKLPKPRPRYTPRPRPPSEDDDNVHERLPSLDLGERTASQYTFPVGPPKKAKKLPRLKPEVVITTVPRRLKGRTPFVRQPSPEPASSASMAAVKRKSAKGKEKETAVAEPARPGSPSRVPKPARSQSQPRAPTREPTDGSSSPQPPPPSRGRKRRRVSSLSSLSDGSPAKAVSPEPPPAAPSATRKQPIARGSVRSGYSSDVFPTTSSPLQTDDEDEKEPAKGSGRSHSRTRSLVVPQGPSSRPIYPPVFPLYTPRHDDSGSSASNSRYLSDRDERHTPFPVLQDAQAQYAMAQAWHSLSYLMASGAFQPPPPPSGPGYPPGLPFPPVPWPPYTPSHRRHNTVPSHFLATSSSSEAGPSRSSTYSTPTHHPHPYPYSYDPRFSNSTLPPSSPIPSSSSPNSSPILRPASVPPGQRSRSRGRRVSFKLDDNDRPLPPTPSQNNNDVDSDDEPLSSLARRRGASASTSAAASGQTSAAKGKGKGKARAETPRREEEDERPARGRPPPPRARTPGPPSQREMSVPRALSGKGSSSTKEPKSASKRKG